MKDVVQEDENKFDIAGLSDAVRGRINCTTASGEVIYDLCKSSWSVIYYHLSI